MNIFVIDDIPLEELNSRRWTDFLKALHPEYPIPKTPEDILIIFRRAHAIMTNEIENDNFLPVLFVQGAKIHDVYFAFSLVMNRNNVYAYVDLYFTEDFDSIEEELKKFVMESIDQAKETYKKEIRCVMFDLEEFDQDNFINSCYFGKIIVCRPLLPMIKELKNARIYLENVTEGKAKLDEYNEKLVQLEELFSSYDVSISEAMHILFESVTAGILDINSSWEEILGKYIGCLHIGCHNLNHLYENEILLRKDLVPFADSNFQLNEFITKMMPEFSQDWAFYKMKKEVYDYLIKKNVQDSLDFWQQSLRQFPKLGHLAIDALKIPVTPNKIDISEMCSIIKKYGKEDEYMINYKINMFLRKF